MNCHWICTSPLIDIRLAYLPTASPKLIRLIILRLSPIARTNSIKILFSVAVNQRWPIYQLDVKNAFLYGDLLEMYMEQSPEYVAQEEMHVQVEEGNLWPQT